MSAVVGGKEIEVRVPADFLAAQGPNNVARGIQVVNRLKEAGIPVQGVLFPEGVEHGALVIYNDTMFGDTVYCWRPEIPE